MKTQSPASSGSAIPRDCQALEFYRMCKKACEPFTEALTHTEKVFGADACELACSEYKQDMLAHR